VNLKKKKYLITGDTLEKCLEVLEDHFTSSSGIEEWNNEDVIEVYDCLKKEIKEND